MQPCHPAPQRAPIERRLMVVEAGMDRHHPAGFSQEELAAAGEKLEAIIGRPLSDISTDALRRLEALLELWDANGRGDPPPAMIKAVVGDG
jgi:hypothetical protein